MQRRSCSLRQDSQFAVATGREGDPYCPHSAFGSKPSSRCCSGCLPEQVGMFAIALRLTGVRHRQTVAINVDTVVAYSQVQICSTQVQQTPLCRVFVYRTRRSVLTITLASHIHISRRQPRALIKPP
jgi:hypothetical protein